MLDKTVSVRKLPLTHRGKPAHFVFSYSVTKSVGLQSSLAGFDFEVRRLLGDCKEISFLHITLESAR
jgi:hypothetical protein